jgi:hypothetical protein
MIWNKFSLSLFSNKQAQTMLKHFPSKKLRNVITDPELERMHWFLSFT